MFSSMFLSVDEKKNQRPVEVMEERKKTFKKTELDANEVNGGSEKKCIIN